MTATSVDAAVAAIERRDPRLGEWAQVAADGLTAGEGEDALCQALVQDFLWYRLPAKYPERAWLPVSRAAAALLGELGLIRDRYLILARVVIRYVLFDSYALCRGRLPVQITLDKLEGDGGVAQW